MIGKVLIGFVFMLSQPYVERTGDGNTFLQQNNNIKAPGDTTFVLTDTLVFPKHFGTGSGQLSKNGLKYYVSLMDSSSGFTKLYVMTRNNIGEDFDSLNLSMLSGIADTFNLFNDIQPTITEDGKVMVFVRNMNDSWYENDLWIAERDSSEGPFESLRPLNEINIDGQADAYPWISPDGLHLYFTQGNYLYMVSRTSRDSLFGAQESLAVNFSGAVNFSSFLTNDELEIYFESSSLIYYAKRDSIEGAFSTPIVMPEFSGKGFVSGPSMTPDSMEFYLYNVPQKGVKWILKFVNVKHGVEENAPPPGRGVATLQILKNKIYLEMAEARDVELKVYDLSGRERETIYEGTLNKGTYTFNSRVKNSGIYFVKLETDNLKETKKLVLIK